MSMLANSCALTASAPCVILDNTGEPVFVIDPYGVLPGSSGNSTWSIGNTGFTEFSNGLIQMTRLGIIQFIFGTPLVDAIAGFTFDQEGLSVTSFGGDPKLVCDNNGNIGDGTNTADLFNVRISGNVKMDENGNIFILEGTPASAAAAGIVGQFIWDANFIYMCIAPNTWKRAALSTW